MNLAKPNRPEWRASVSVDILDRGRKTGTKEVVIPHTQISECPVSYITAESLQVLELVQISRVTNESAGASMFGSKVAKWPAWYVDATVGIQSAISATMEAQHK